jgi:hypothetical protein
VSAPPIAEPPPPRAVPAALAAFAAVTTIAAWYPWRFRTCTRLEGCDARAFAAPIESLGGLPLVALFVVTVSAIVAVWRPTRITWQAAGWAGLVTGGACLVAIGAGRLVAFMESPWPGLAPFGFLLGAFGLASCGVAVMATGGLLPSERLPRATRRPRRRLDM